MTNKTKGVIIKTSSTVLCVGAPLTATIIQFPIWINKGDAATMSGIFLMLAVICCIPFFRQIKAFLKSPAAYILFTVLAVIMTLVRNIIDQMVIVFWIGAAANWIGAGLYKWAKVVSEKPDKTTNDIYIIDSEEGDR